MTKNAVNSLPEEDLNPLFYALLSNSSDGIAFIASDRKIRYANEQITLMLGVSLETVIGSCFELILPVMSQQISEIIGKIRKTGKPFKLELNPYNLKDEPERNVTCWNVTIGPVNGKDDSFWGWILMLQDVTEPKKVEAEKKTLLKEMAQIKILNKLPESMPAGIVLLDGASFIVKWFNQACLAFLDIPNHLNDLTGLSFEDYLPQGMKSELLEVLRKVVKSREPFCLELVQQGDIFWNCNVVPIPTEVGIPDLVLVTYEITEQIVNRKKVIEYARQAENHLHQLEVIIENIEDGVIIFDLNGEIYKQNIAALELLGFDDFMDCPDNLFEIYSDLELYDLDGNLLAFEEWPLNRIIRGEVIHNFEVALWRPSVGQIRFMSYNGALIEKSNQTSVLAIMMIRDISDREKLLRELEQEHNRLQAVLEQMPCGVIMFDAFSLKQILANKKYTEIWRVPKAGLELSENNQPGEMFHCDGRAYNIDELPIIRSINQGELVSNEEIVCQRKDGSIVNVICNSTPILDRDGRIVAGVLVFSDITELKEATTKAALANQLHQIIEFLPDGIFVVDQERKVIAWNRAIELLTGILKEDVIGTANTYIFDGFNQLTLVDAIFDGLYQDTDLLQKNGDVFSKQVLLSSLNHRENVLLDIKATRIQNERGAILGVIQTIRDITNQRELETETIRMQKLESLGILAGGIAHDFNNILAAILANLQLAAIKLQKHQDISKYLDNTIETTRKASDLTKQLLTFAKGGIPIKKIILVSKMIKDTVQFALSGSNIKAVFHLQEDLWLVNADEGQMTQVINNLIINAEQAMPAGGIIEIYGSNVIYEASGKYESGRYVKIAVKDHGTGIPEEIIHKIFDPFFTTKKIGSGLGLSTTYSIIKRHGGYLEVESSPGIGATFYILLPASTEELVMKESPVEINVAVEAKVLLLEDEDVIRNVSGELLAFFGYRVVLARDGQEAVELYQKANKIGDPFLAVVMDLTIPGGIGGLETLAILRRIDPDIKAIVSSGYANDPVISDYEKYGFCGVVIKPYKFDDLISVLNKVIEKKQLPLDLTY